MVSTISPAQMETYKRTARARLTRERENAATQRRSAWAVARAAAGVLKEKYGASRVVVFGSLTHDQWFGPRSDIDLAVAGIPADTFWRAWCALDRINSDFEIDLVAIESASDNLRDNIARHGVDL